MKKVKYYYNKRTLRYEKIEDSISKRVLYTLGFLATSVLFAVVLLALAYQYYSSPKEKELKEELALMKEEYKLMNDQLEEMDKVLSGLENRDDNIYRVIFEAEPIPDAVREQGIGGYEQYQYLRNRTNSDVMIDARKKMDKLSRQLYLQSKSYDELSEMITNKEKMLASIPAIQPVSNKDLTRIASGFGYRIHPIYKTYKRHTGTDFTASTGTEIYCTGDGTVEDVRYSKRGYGKYVVVNHGFGYHTLYAHMSKISVKEGQKVKRGDVLGAVGNTGTSTAPHLHYEVWKDGIKIDPINYFYNDLTPEEYDEMIRISSSHNQSFD